MTLAPSELILNKDGSVYHLHLLPGDISDTIITVGDVNRVDQVSHHFDKILLTKQNREFKTVTGELNGHLISVISTGIGTDNIDIVFNEIDALFNIDLKTRLVKSKQKKLTFIRIGTSGAISSIVPLDSFILSVYAMGLDGLLNFYDSEKIRVEGLEKLLDIQLAVYAVKANETLIDQFDEFAMPGITITANGFYGPQFRSLRLKPAFDFFTALENKKFKDLSFTNLEMETAGIYGLSALLGHKAISLNAILANRKTGEFSVQPQKTIDLLIKKTLELLCH